MAPRRLYIWWCGKCGDYVLSAITAAPNRAEARKEMLKDIWAHELAYHHGDEEEPRGRVLWMVPKEKIR